MSNCDRSMTVTGIFLSEGWCNLARLCSIEALLDRWELSDLEDMP